MFYDNAELSGSTAIGSNGYPLIFWLIRQLSTMPYCHDPYIVILNLIEKTIWLYNNFTKGKFWKLWKRPSRLRILFEPEERILCFLAKR